MFLSKTSKKQNNNYVDSLRPYGNLTLVSKVCKAVPKSLFCAPNGLNELPEGCFEFLFTLIGKSTMAFQQTNHGAYSNPSRGGAPEQ